MKKEFVPYEQALRLKALEFDEPCMAYFEQKVLKRFDPSFLEAQIFNSDFVKKAEYCTAPTWQSVFEWFRKKHKMVGTVQITVSVIDRENWFWEIYNLQGRNIDDGQKLSDPYNTSYKEAELACLKKLIEIVESKTE